MKKTFFLLTRILLGGVFVVSGFQKLIVPAQNFQTVIEQFEVVKGPAAAFLSHLIPWTEWVFGIFLVLGLWMPLPFFVLWFMNALFIGILYTALSRRLPIEKCGCFGDALPFTLHQILAVDLTLFTFFAIFFLFGRRADAPSLDRFFVTTHNENTSQRRTS